MPHTPESRIANLRKSRPIGWCKASLAPTEHPTTFDIVWAAGIFEGEGCANKNGSHLEVAQKDEWLLNRFRALFGGSIEHNRVNGFDPTKTISRWYLTGPRARGLVMSIYKFMSPRRQGQIQCFLKAQGVGL